VTQYLSAGLLIAAVGDELLPKLFEKKDATNKGWCDLAIAVGFFAGIGLMLLLEHFLDDDDDDSEKSVENSVEAGDKQSALVSTGNKADGNFNSAATGKSSSSRKSNRSHVSLRRVSAALASGEVGNAAVPWGVAVPIYVDSGVDGLLIGICCVASLQGGAIMATATSIEMFFLGVTFGAMIRKCGAKRWAVGLLAPLILCVAGTVGAVFADALSAHPWAFQGVVAFGASALLFLVVEELLKEAVENAEEADSWRVNPTIWLFIGFFIVVLSGRLLPSES
jgi:ZIP family zinc transporter